MRAELPATCRHHDHGPRHGRQAVEAIKAGAFDYIAKPFEQEEIRVRSSTRRPAGPANPSARSSTLSALARERRALGSSASRPPMRRIYAIIAARCADTPSTVLITGESGTGKELVATRAARELAAAASKPFIKVNCAAIPEDLMESSCSATRSGAFTGAVDCKPGRFELADGGTLFLDEIGEIPVEMQVKLLRVLQEREFERVGGIKTIKVDVRLIAATNRDLERRSPRQAFREDLFYRLNVVPIALPPLRERRERHPAARAALHREVQRSG